MSIKYPDPMYAKRTAFEIDDKHLDSAIELLRQVQDDAVVDVMKYLQDSARCLIDYCERYGIKSVADPAFHHALIDFIEQGDGMDCE